MKEISHLFGISPAKIISHEIEKMNISQRDFAKKLNIHYQTLNAILKCKRRVPLEISLKLDEAFNFPESTLLILQAYNDVKEYKLHQRLTLSSRMPKIRPIVFWDTDISKIDWVNQKKVIIQRVKERGNIDEKIEISRFYNIPFDIVK